MNKTIDSLQEGKMAHALNRGFWSRQKGVVATLEGRFPSRAIGIGQMEATRTNKKQIQILEEISDKLSSYYGESVDAVTWFVVLYHGTDALERFTYREIEQLLRDIGASHNGRNGESTYYNNTSINRLLVVLGWESFEHTDHTSVGKNVRSKRISIAGRERVEGLVSDIQTKMAGANIPKQNSNEPSTVYAERVLAHIEQYAPEVNNLGRRVKAQVLNSLTNASIFTADSFRDRSKKD